MYKLDASFTADLPKDRPFRITFSGRSGSGYHIGFFDIAVTGVPSQWLDMMILWIVLTIFTKLCISAYTFEIRIFMKVARKWSLS